MKKEETKQGESLHPEEVAKLVRKAHLEGRLFEQEKWEGVLIPETVEITLRTRDKNDKMESVRSVITFDQIKSSVSMMELILYETAKKLEEGKILKTVLTP